jgi:glycosyltransferase involved in cell wall biosynthesis
MNNKKIILVGTTASNLYGFRKDFILSCLRQGYEVYAFVSEYNDYWLENIRNIGAIPITYQLSRGGLNPFKDIYSIYQLSKKIKKIKPEIVFSYSAKPTIYGTLAARLAKVPRVVGMLEGLGYAFTEQPTGFSKKTKTIRNIQVLLYKIAFLRLDDLILLNPDDKKDLLNSHSINVSAVHILGPTGLDLKEYNYVIAPTSPMSFLFIGRLLKEKGIFEFIDAIKIVKNIYPDTKFIILGEIDTENLGALTEKKLKDLISQGLFEYPGYVSNVANWINQSSVFVLPSYREGVPRSTQESMAIGRPVITTDVPGCRETVINDVTGFLVPRWDPKALAEKMIYFIENPEQVNIMGYQGYLYAKDNFDAEKINEKLLKIVGVKT